MMDQHLVDFWEANKDDDAFIEELLAALLKRVPKITVTKDKNGDIVSHLINCPLMSKSND